ncbi:MAG TPA: MFS transporter [Burkholderiaceae bacterium]|nr:MFS transporter [Burkholderiaceae bacterium]
MPLSAEPERSHWRLGALFAAYFALAGVLAPYMPLYFQSRGLGAFEIGVLVALGQSMRVIGPNLWGYLADHAERRTPILRATTIALMASFCLLFAPGGFSFVFCVMLLLNLFQTAQMPVAEALASARLRGRDDAATRYGRLRLWGSAGFVVVVMAAGPVFDRFGIGAALWLGAALCALLVIAAWRIEEQPAHEAGHERVSVRNRLREPRVRWFLLSAALMVFAHGALYTYLSIYLAQLGYSKTAIGVFWVLSVVFEIGFFFTQGRWFARFGLNALLSASFLVAAVRFLLIAQLATVWWVLVFAQLLHAMTFAVHHSACVLTIQRWFPGRAAARGQAVYISAAYGIGGTAGSLVAAYLWTIGGPQWAFGACSAVALLGAWAVRRAQRLDPAPHEIELADSRSV